MPRYQLRPPSLPELGCAARELRRRDDNGLDAAELRAHCTRLALTPAWRTRDKLRAPEWPAQHDETTIHIWAAIGASDALSMHPPRVTTDHTGPHAAAYTAAYAAVLESYMNENQEEAIDSIIGDQGEWTPPEHPPMMGPWRTSAWTIPLLDEAMCVAQEMIEAAKKDLANDFFDSKYAGLSSVMAIVKPACTAARIARYQPAWTDDGPGVIVTTRLACKGEWCEADLRIPVDKTNAQALGSAVTYGRRFGISAMLGVPTEDDDGNAAAASPPRESKSGGKNSDAIGARCSGKGWPGALGREVHQLAQDLATLAGADPIDVWWDLLPDAGVDQQPYMDTDGEWPSHARVLSTSDGKWVKAEALKKIADARQT